MITEADAMEFALQRQAESIDMARDWVNECKELRKLTPAQKERCIESLGEFFLAALLQGMCDIAGEDAEAVH